MRASNVLCSLLLITLAGCAGGPSARPEISPIEPRVDVLPGRTLVMPVELSGPIDPGQTVDAHFDDGRRPSVGLYWISVGPEQNPDPRAWLAPAGEWFATPASAASRPSAAGVWAVIVDIPSDAPGQGLWLHGRRIAFNWLSDPAASPLGAIAPAARLPADTGSPWLAGLLEPERQSPPRRWRWVLVSGGLDPRAAHPPSMAFADPVLEALAVQNEARWTVALQRLAQDNPALASQLVERLGQLVDFGSAVAPTWPGEGRDLDNLLDDLLSPALGPTGRISRVNAWLAAQPQAVAWVSDDAGLRDAPDSEFSATVGIANLSSISVLAGMAPDDGSIPGDLVPLRPSAAAMLAAPVSPGPDQSRAAVPVRIRAGAWEASMPVWAARSPARPPGLRIGPLLPDWTMEEWLAGRQAGVIADADGAVMLLMHDQNTGWTLYVESRRDSAARADDVVRVWLGPAGAPTSILRASSDGLVAEEAGPGIATQPASRIPVSTGPDGRWSCMLPIPARCIEPDGTLLIGVERVDAAGRRSAWPRPMLPWQTEPGRIAVDTTVWGGLGLQTGP